MTFVPPNGDTDHPSGSSTPQAQARLVRLHDDDNVGIATEMLMPGQSVAIPPPADPSSSTGNTIVVCQRIPPGHKMAIAPIDADTDVRKYGQRIGKATQPIRVGDHVHDHNLADDHRIAVRVDNRHPPQRPTPIRATFQGYHRPGGKVGTRNCVGLIATVNCSASVCHAVLKRFDDDRLARWPNVDGVFVATHTTGCALRYGGQKHEMLGRVLSGYARHANVAGCLMIGLGCEQTTAGYLAEHHQMVSLYGPDGRQLTRDDGVPMIVMQTEGGTRATIEKADALLEQVLDRANACPRAPADASHLSVALECGGSDAYSGWTANPAVGAAADRFVACGGSAVISETTELYGAEHLLVDRSRSDDVANALLDKIRWWKEHVAMFGGQIDNNPSVGNKAGGLTTITEKSLGAVCKSGSTTLQAVYDYAQRIDRAGLSVMDSPGFDPASVTGKVAGGCNLVLFTTGRGSCFGCKPVPVIKIASNSDLFHRMREDMDVNAGDIADGHSVDQVGQRIFEFSLDVASGRKTSSEELGIGDHEFIPWTVGPTL
ncbi:UxaA family hydrolase [Crateriforma conspicua]|uniref:D-galactarate dehydratase n=1 Tax=Crateriforma conspicua TaxID=2527996 RepID=A0A5C5Y579_9PLAN|nr:altronate dehydratase family protein [Crateriforma conspicua]TWT70078.1 D-galactarate dehydratase [Crateriforma conspicua]